MFRKKWNEKSNDNNSWYFQFRPAWKIVCINLSKFKEFWNSQSCCPLWQGLQTRFFTFLWKFPRNLISVMLFLSKKRYTLLHKSSRTLGSLGSPSVEKKSFFDNAIYKVGHVAFCIKLNESIIWMLIDFLQFVKSLYIRIRKIFHLNPNFAFLKSPSVEKKSIHENTVLKVGHVAFCIDLNESII